MYLGADNQNSEKITTCPSCRGLKHIQQLAASVEQTGVMTNCTWEPFLG